MEIGLPWIAPPEITRREDGFMKEEFYASETRFGKLDLHHGNAEYGEVMMQEIIAFLDGYLTEHD